MLRVKQNGACVPQTPPLNEKSQSLLKSNLSFFLMNAVSKGGVKMINKRKQKLNWILLLWKGGLTTVPKINRTVKALYFKSNILHDHNVFALCIDSDGFIKSVLKARGTSRKIHYVVIFRSCIKQVPATAPPPPCHRRRFNTDYKTQKNKLQTFRWVNK